MWYTDAMPSDQDHHVVWERRQAELWDRVFQVTQDVMALAQTLEGGGAVAVVREELTRSAVAVGMELVRANAADVRTDFVRHVRMARLRAIETDYLLRLVYVLQQQEDIQRDLSSVITQYAAIVDLLRKFGRHTGKEADVIVRHTHGPRVID